MEAQCSAWVCAHVEASNCVAVWRRAGWVAAWWRSVRCAGCGGSAARGGGGGGGVPRAVAGGAAQAGAVGGAGGAERACGVRGCDGVGAARCGVAVGEVLGVVRFALLRGSRPPCSHGDTSAHRADLLVVWSPLLPPASSPPAVPDRHVRSRRSRPGHSHRRCLGRLLGGWVGIEKCPAPHSPYVVARHCKSTADPKPRIHRFTDPEQFPNPEQIPNKPRVLAPRHFVPWRTSP
jgi:hypothetical protein